MPWRHIVIVTNNHTIKMYRGVKVWIHAFLTSSLYGREWSVLRPIHYNPGVRAPDTVYKKLSGPQTRWWREEIHSGNRTPVVWAMTNQYSELPHLIQDGVYGQRLLKCYPLFSLIDYRPMLMDLLSLHVPVQWTNLDKCFTASLTHLTMVWHKMWANFPNGFGNV